MRDERTDAWKDDGLTDNSEAICPHNFFEVVGIEKEIRFEGQCVVISCMYFSRHYYQDKK